MASWIWVLIPIVAILAGVMKRWISLKEREIDHLQRDAVDKQARYAAMTERLRAEVRQLKERLAVIERITIEKESSLEREIESLRHR